MAAEAARKLAPGSARSTAVRARGNSGAVAGGYGRVRLRNDEIFDVAEAFDLDADTLAG